MLQIVAAWVRRKACKYFDVRERGCREEAVGRWERIARRISGGELVRRSVGGIWCVSVLCGRM